MNRKTKEKIRAMINGRNLVNKSGDIAYYCETQKEFVIDFNNLHFKGTPERLEFKYINNFKVMK